MAQTVMDFGLHFIKKAFRRIASSGINRMAEAGLLKLGRFGMKLLFDKIVQRIEEQLLAKVLSNIIAQIGKMLESYILSWFSPACPEFFTLVDDASSLIDDLNGCWVTPLTARLLPFVVDLLRPVVARLSDYFFDLFYVNLAKPNLIWLTDNVLELGDTLLGKSLTDFFLQPIESLMNGLVKPKTLSELSNVTEQIAHFGCNLGQNVPGVDSLSDNLQHMKGSVKLQSHPDADHVYHIRGEFSCGLKFKVPWFDITVWNRTMRCDVKLAFQPPGASFPEGSFYQLADDVAVDPRLSAEVSPDRVKQFLMIAIVLLFRVLGFVVVAALFLLGALGLHGCIRRSYFDYQRLQRYDPEGSAARVVLRLLTTTNPAAHVEEESPSWSQSARAAWTSSSLSCKLFAVVSATATVILLQQALLLCHQWQLRQT